MKLVAKFVQLQSRLVNAQKDQNERPEPKRRTKELVFVLPLISQVKTLFWSRYFRSSRI